MTLRINAEAPNFTAETTEGTIAFHDWIGDGWAILFSHPKDFTPVCTTELGYMASLKKEFEELASSRGIQLRIKTRTIPAAIAALQQGRHSEHDRLIAAAAAEVGPCDALVLGQFSMARAAAGIPAAAGRKVFTSPHSAVARLKQMFAD